MLQGPHMINERRGLGKTRKEFQVQELYHRKPKRFADSSYNCIVHMHRFKLGTWIDSVKWQYDKWMQIC